MKVNAKRLAAEIIFFMALAFGGCADSAATMEEEVVELHEPKGISASTEPVTRRNLYKAAVFEGAVYPYVEEYAFGTNQKFGSYGAMLGDTVQKGDVLMNADSEERLEKEEVLEERLAELTQEYETFRKETEEALYIQGLELERLEGILANLERDKPEEYAADDEGMQTANPEYASWQSEYTKWEGECSLKGQDISVNKEKLAQKRELYELDYGYYNGQLQELKRQGREETIVSQISGVVVNQGFYLKGDTIIRGAAVAAVADMERKFVKCSPIAKYQLSGAAEIYAFIGGERREVDYLESDRNSTTFTFREETEDVSVGDYAVVAVVADSRENVLAVREADVFSDGVRQAVYVMEEGTRALRYVETGMSDGVYVEILSGLEEGEAVLSQSMEAGEQVAVLERGTRELAYTGTGYLFLPVYTVVKNPVKYGTAFYEGSLLRENVHVEKGEALGQIRVETDEVDIASRETELRRMKERLADLEAENREENEENIQKRREEIARLEEELAERKADAERTEIYSDADGFLQYLPLQKGEVLESDTVVALVADEKKVYVIIDISENKTLNYGDVLTASYTDKNGKEERMECRALTLGALGTALYSAQNMAILSVPEESLEELPLVDTYTYGSQIKLYRPTGYVNRMENVVMVPAKAVTEAQGQTYVNLLREDGSVMPVAFLAGGRDKEYYWVIEGLTEGMKICWE